MGVWTYYSPFGLGVLLTLSLYQDIFAIDSVAAVQPHTQWTVLAILCLVAGIHCQIIMVGAQGALAQVLPVPRGRSIRGRGAVVAGGLLLLYSGCALAMLLLRSDEFATPSLVFGALGLTSLLVAIITYAWCWPIAVRDFDDRRTAQ